MKSAIECNYSTIYVVAKCKFKLTAFIKLIDLLVIPSLLLALFQRFLLLIFALLHHQ